MFPNFIRNLLAIGVPLVLAAGMLDKDNIVPAGYGLAQSVIEGLILGQKYTLNGTVQVG